MLKKDSVIGVVGSGAMGLGIAQVAATFGHRVLIYDNNEGALQKAAKTLEASLAKLTEKQKISSEESNSILSRVNLRKNSEAFPLVIW